MPDQITNAFVKQYSRDIYLTLADKGYKFKDAVMHDTTVRENDSHIEIPHISTTVAKEATPYSDTPEPAYKPRRLVHIKTYNKKDLLNESQIKKLIDPKDTDTKDTYVKRQVEAIGRQMDKTIHDALVGTAQTGADGLTGVNLPANQNIADDDTNLTVQKILAIRKKLKWANNVLSKEELFLVVTPEQTDALLKSTLVNSHDYNNIKPLVAGEVNHYAGFTFIDWNHLPIKNGVRQCVAFAKSGIMMASWSDVKTSMDILPMKNNSLQILTSTTFGATRLDEQKVITVDCKE